MPTNQEIESTPLQQVSPRSGQSETRANRVFQALSNPTRRAILRSLAEGAKTVSEVVEQFTLSQPTISRHLAILLQAELVLRRRQGQCVIYSLNHELMLEVGSIPIRVSRDRRVGRTRRAVAPW